MHACHVTSYSNVVLHDYLRAILGLTRSNSTWILDPRVEVRKQGQAALPRGEGNVVSVEVAAPLFILILSFVLLTRGQFNMLYRWHSTLSKADTAFTEGAFKQIFGPDVDFGKVTLPSCASTPRSSFLLTQTVHHCRSRPPTLAKRSTHRQLRSAPILAPSTSLESSATRALASLMTPTSSRYSGPRSTNRAPRSGPEVSQVTPFRLWNYAVANGKRGNFRYARGPEGGGHHGDRTSEERLGSLHRTSLSLAPFTAPGFTFT
jgi:hypothetical protein